MTQGLRMLTHEKKLILDVLAGNVTEASHPALFDEDTVYFAVWRIESTDFDWLTAQLARATSREGWLQVASVLSEVHRKELSPPSGGTHTAGR